MSKLNENLENQEMMENSMNIELSEEIAEGIYSNLAVISHSNAEFVVDFILLVPNVPKAKVKSRIILTPQHAKRLLGAMADNIKRYEQQFGEIVDPNANNYIQPMHFTTRGEA
jgi:Protein of unknown function (DUF3467)